MVLTVLSVFTIYAITGHPFYYTRILWYLMILLSVVNVSVYQPLMNKKNRGKGLCTNGIRLRSSFET